MRMDKLEQRITIKPVPLGHSIYQIEILQNSLDGNTCTLLTKKIIALKFDLFFKLFYRIKLNLAQINFKFMPTKSSYQIKLNQARVNLKNYSYGA